MNLENFELKPLRINITKSYLLIVNLVRYMNFNVDIYIVFNLQEYYYIKRLLFTINLLCWSLNMEIKCYPNVHIDAGNTGIDIHLMYLIKLNKQTCPICLVSLTYCEESNVKLLHQKKYN